MNKDFTEMDDAEIVQMLANYEYAGQMGTLDTSNTLEMPTKLLIQLVGALAYVDEKTGFGNSEYDWLRKNLESEYYARFRTNPGEQNTEE